ncbi:MAG: ATP-dependent helicase [Candidatus Adiutrix sp.]|jgi:DNA helicase-2/ATP-dependent DNA helicase PcrA|nr:ATP-dependent helicase [Candidatus Adiutrix sp.]
MTLFEELEAAAAGEPAGKAKTRAAALKAEKSDPEPRAAGPLDLASRLNASQLAAATYEGGPLLIVAGAGSGKTRTLVHRVAYLLDQGVPPPAILLLTFTRKAAQEMLGRAAALAGRRASDVAGGTFHALANMLLRSQAHLLGYPAGFSIMDQDDAESLISRIRGEMPEAKRHKRFPQKGAILNMLSQAVNKDRPLAEVIADAFPHFLEYAPVIDKIGSSYREHKIKNALMDFDDLLTGLEKVMREHEDVRRRIAGRYDYILVDEYQDTNPIQARLTRLLGRDHQRVTAVGDDAQSIYAFRGASFRNIMDFPKIFPGTKILKLEDNYRSKAPILQLANHLIAQAREKYDKKLKATRGAGPEPQMTAVQDQADEAGWVAARIEEFIEEGVPLNRIAVLFRAASHSFDLEVELARRRIPFTKYGGRKFLEAAHIKDFLSFLRVAANPSDGLSLRRMLSLTEGIGIKGAQEIADWVGGRRERLLDLASSPARGKAQKNLAPLAELMKTIAGPGEELNFRLKAVADFYYGRVRDLYPDDWPERQGDLREIIRMAESREGLNSFLADMTLDPPNHKKTDPNGSNSPDLTLSTIHSAKGLEWQAVFLLGAVEGRFPPAYAARSAEEVEEERRLMYVAVTRAEDHLFIMLPLGEMDRRTGLAARPSRFLAALPRDCGARLCRDGRDLDPSELLNLGGDFGYDEDSPASPSAAPTGQKAALARARPAARPAQRPPLTALPGQRVAHPIYGPGLVLETADGLALIDFDHFGRKKVTMQYARLTAV